MADRQRRTQAIRTQRASLLSAVEAAFRGAETSRFGIVIVGAVAAAVYLNTLANGLHVDDQYQIVVNPWIRSLRNLPTIFSSGVWDFDGRISSYYRPMMYVLYSLVYAVAGTAPWAYHFLNIVLHVGATALVFLIAQSLLPVGKDRPWWLAPALLAGLLFAVHPIHTEPVAWAAGVVDLSYACFSLLAFYLVISGRDRRGSRAGALAAYGAALLSKEPAITLPAVLVVYWALRDGGRVGVSGLVRRTIPWAVVSLAYLAARTAALGGVAPQTAVISLSPLEYLLTALSLMGRFIRAQVLPTTLNFWHVFTPVTSLASPEAWLAVLTVGLWAALFGVALARRALAPAIGLALMVVPLTPTLFLGSLNQGLENAFAERYLYLPSFGVVLLAGWIVAALYRRRPSLAMGGVILFAALGEAGASVTVHRNPVWKNSLSLWADAAAKSPSSGIANQNFGFALIAAGMEEEGRSYVGRAVALKPELVEYRMRRALAYASFGRTTDAMRVFRDILILDPRSAAAHYNLGLLYEKQESAEAALAEYDAAIALDPASADAQANAGRLRLTLGQRDRAIAHLEAASRLRPEDAAIRASLAGARAAAGR